MTAPQIVSRLESMGVAVWSENGRVCYQDPHRVITPAVLQTLQSGKAEVLRVVANRAKPFSGPAVATVAEPLEALARAGDLESKLFEVMDYKVGSGLCGDWVGQQEILRRMGEPEAVVLELLGALEAHGRAMAFRRYQSNTLWRILAPKGMPEHVTPPRGYKPVNGPSFTDWEMN